MIRAVETRPSLQLPPEIFAAVIELEELAHIVGATPPTGHGPAHIQAVVNAGGARDRLGRLILDFVDQAYRQALELPPES